MIVTRPSTHASPAPACVLRPLVGVNRPRTPALHAGTQTTRGHVRVTHVRVSGAREAAPNAAIGTPKESRELRWRAGVIAVPNPMGKRLPEAGIVAFREFGRLGFPFRLPA